MNASRILAQAQGYAKLGILTRSVYKNLRVSFMDTGTRKCLRDKTENTLRKIYGNFLSISLI